MAELEGLSERPTGQALDRRAPRSQLRRQLSEWGDLVTGNVPAARGVLRAALADRIRFRPLEEDGVVRKLELTVPIGWDRVLTGLVPAWSRLQDRVASPKGYAPFRLIGRVAA